MKRKKFLVVFGTRPEVIKLFSVIQELKKFRKEAVIKICVTAQHREMLDSFLREFRIKPDYDLKIMLKNQSPSKVASLVFDRLEPVLKREKPDYLVIQGDTTTVAAAAMTAFYNRVKIAHVEAGLRTFNRWQPFPEEINRQIAGILADIHFAPTRRARENLIQEGIPKNRIYITGNPVIDSLQSISQQIFEGRRLSSSLQRLTLDTRKWLLVTCHRRENFGRPLENICKALRVLSKKYKNKILIIYPVHLNPQVRRPVYQWLSGIENIMLLPPLDYFSLVYLVRLSYLVLTDSGGIQEEAPSLGKPVLVLREVTERPEAVEAGTVRIVGTDSRKVIQVTTELIEDRREYERMAKAVNPYGDGKASRRIAAILLGKPFRPFRGKY